MELRRILLICLLGMFSINILADNYKFDYAVINNEKVTTVNAPNITATLISSTKATVTYQNETIVLVSKDSLKYEGRGKNGVIVVANKVKGVLSRITIGATVNNQIVMLVYKQIYHESRYWTYIQIHFSYNYTFNRLLRNRVDC